MSLVVPGLQLRTTVSGDSSALAVDPPGGSSAPASEAPSIPDDQSMLEPSQSLDQAAQQTAREMSSVGDPASMMSRCEAG